MKYRNKTNMILVMSVLMLTGFYPCTGVSSSLNSVKGQSVYVSIYSHIYHGNHERPLNLTTTLSIRNTDPKHMITVNSVDYYNSDGNFIRNYIKKPLKIKKFATIRYVIKSTDRTGGSGAKFIVRWESKEPVNPPLIETIMISTSNQQGISFISRGIVIKE